MVITRKELFRPKEDIVRREKKLQYRQAPKSPPVFVCVDWGASYWRHYDSHLGSTSNAEPSLVVYKKERGEFLSGQKAFNMWLTNNDCIRFDNLKKLFDVESNYYQEECDRLRKISISNTIEDMLEHWWLDRFGALLKRIPQGHKIKFAVAHPAHFSASSVKKFRDFFAKSRNGHEFDVIVSEESTAALHGSRYCGFKAGDLVLVLDGGKSTIDCACLNITSVDPSLTTVIYKTNGLPFGGDFVNQKAKHHADPIVDVYRTGANKEITRLIGGADFERMRRNWWESFETTYKKDLHTCHQDALLEKVGCVPVEGLFETVQQASKELAKRTRGLVESMICEMEVIVGERPSAIICLGGYCQSKELRKELHSVLPTPEFECHGLDGNDVIDGLRNLVHNPERAAWQFSPQHYLLTQHSEKDSEENEKEALLLYQQGEALAKSDEKVRLLSPRELIERKRISKTPYHIPGHLVAMDVKLDSDKIAHDERIIHQVEISTAKELKTHSNKKGFQVSKLEDTTLLHSYDITLPSHYRRLFEERKTLTMYNCIVGEGQDIVLFTIRPLDQILQSDTEWMIEWMTLPEILGTFGESSFEIFKTSINVTVAYKQTITQNPGTRALRGDRKLRSLANSRSAAPPSDSSNHHEGGFLVPN